MQFVVHALQDYDAMRRLQAYQLSIDICCLRPRSAVNPPTAAAAVDRWDRQTDDWTEGHPTVT